MILTETKLFEKVFENYGINIAETHDFSASFDQLECEEDFGRYEKDLVYPLWHGNLVIDGVKKYFICPIDGKVIDIKPEVFSQSCEPSITFIAGDGRMYTKIYTSTGLTSVIPSWWLDFMKVKKKAYISASVKVTGKFEYIGDGEKTFFAWVFYKGKEILKIFNIETGEFVQTDTAIMQLSLQGKQILKDIEFCQEYEFVIGVSKKQD